MGGGGTSRCGTGWDPRPAPADAPAPAAIHTGPEAQGVCPVRNARRQSPRGRSATYRQRVHGSAYFLRRPQSARRGLRTAPPRAWPRPPAAGAVYLPVPRPGPRRPGSWLPSLPTPGLPHLPRFQSPSRAAQTAPARRRTLGAQPHRVSSSPAIPHPSRRPAHPNGSADLERSKLLRTRSAVFNIPAPPSSATPLSFGEIFVPTSCQSSTSSLERPRNRSLIGSSWEPTPRMGVDDRL